MGQTVTGTLYYGTAPYEEETDELSDAVVVLREKSDWFKEINVGWVGSAYGYTEAYIYVEDSEISTDWGAKYIPDLGALEANADGYNWYGLIGAAVEELAEMGIEFPGQIGWHVAALEG